MTAVKEKYGLDIDIDDGYPYAGLFNVPVDMAKAFEKGEVSKQLEQDIYRVRQVVEWADGLKDAPEIIEDQYQVYKHPKPNKIVKKTEPKILYVKKAKFASEFKPAWQR